MHQIKIDDLLSKLFYRPFLMIYIADLIILFQTVTKGKEKHHCRQHRTGKMKGNADRQNDTNTNVEDIFQKTSRKKNN